VKISLVWPCYQYPSAGGTEEPLGILYLASAIRALGEDVSYIDLTGEPDLRICNDVESSDIVGISSTTPLFGKAKIVLDHIRTINKKAIFLVGGPHATIDPADALDAGFDFAVMGEGEGAVTDLIKAFRSGDPYSVGGIAFRKNGEVRINPRTAFVEDLDSLPFPWREQVDYSKYRSIGLITTRGCPYNCAFCKPTQEKLFGKHIRRRSAANLVDELEEVTRTIGKRKITFKDDTLTLYPREWFEDLHSRMVQRKLGLKWQCNSSVRSLNLEKLRVMKEAGCMQICFGVESGSQKMLDLYGKSQTPEEVVERFQWCHEVGIRPYAFVMVGAPTETVEELELTYRLVKRIKPFNGHIYTVTPLPGTALYDFCLARGSLKPMGYEDYDNANNAEKWRSPLKLDYLTDDDLRKYVSKIARYFGYRAIVGSLRSPEVWKEVLFSKGFRKRARKVLRRVVRSALPFSPVRD